LGLGACAADVQFSAKASRGAGENRLMEWDGIVGTDIRKSELNYYALTEASKEPDAPMGANLALPAPTLVLHTTVRDQKRDLVRRVWNTRALE